MAYTQKQLQDAFSNYVNYLLKTCKTKREIAMVAGEILKDLKPEDLIQVHSNKE